jgi:glycosyltransferase involved in cell wall biosynthesis
VRAFSRQRRNQQLAVLGRYEPSASAYHRAVQEAASDEVRFLGAIYDAKQVQALRYHSAGYLHGHQVGGTNPSLVEALGAGNPVIAHDNPFNRWVAGRGARYFANEDQCAMVLDAVLTDTSTLEAMSISSQQRYAEAFTWDTVMTQYEQLLSKWGAIGL